jgi:hypothetical protein
LQQFQHGLGLGFLQAPHLLQCNLIRLLHPGRQWKGGGGQAVRASGSGGGWAGQSGGLVLGAPASHRQHRAIILFTDVNVVGLVGPS